MTFIQQILNTFTPLYWYSTRVWSYLPQIEAIIRHALNIPDIPPLLKMERDSSLVLVNTHFSEEFPRSLPPWVVPVGGMHCSDKIAPLPDVSICLKCYQKRILHNFVGDGKYFLNEYLFYRKFKSLLTFGIVASFTSALAPTCASHIFLDNSRMRYSKQLANFLKLGLS